MKKKIYLILSHVFPVQVHTMALDVRGGVAWSHLYFYRCWKTHVELDKVTICISMCYSVHMYERMVILEPQAHSDTFSTYLCKNRFDTSCKML